eukprot:jgi/Sobl393_1/19368/SZX76090.1
MVQLLARLPAHQGTLDDQLLEVWCSMAGLAADQSQALLLEMHAGTVDLLLDLEQLIFELSRPAAAVQGEGMPLPLYQGLLCELQCAGELAAQQQQDAQQQQQGQLAGYVEAHVKDEATWQAYAALALRFLLHLLREFPGQLGPATPCVLVPALGQMLSYCSSEVQELCLNAVALMVIHQSHEGAMVAAVLQHALWLLECAAGGLIPDAVASPSWQVAAAACVEVCLPALNSMNMLGPFADRLVQCLCSAAVSQPLQQQQSLWLGLLHEVLLLSPGHAGMAALHLPLVAAAGSSPQAEGVLLQVWQAVGVWAAQPGVRDVVERQVLLLLHPSMHSAPASSTEAAGELPTSPPKKKARKLKQAQLTAEGGFLSSQRPGKGTSSQPSDSGQAAAAAAAASSPSSRASAAELALQTMQQLLQLQPGTPDAAAIARIVAMVASLGPACHTPASLASALGLSATPLAAAAAAAADDDTTDQKQDLHKVQLLGLLLRGLLSVPGQSGALVACVAQQAVAWLPHAARQPDLCAELLPVLLLAMVAAAGSAAAEPGSAEMHMRVWQDARDHLQGASSLYTTGAAGPPSPLLAAVSTAWLTLSRLLGWGGKSAVEAASAQVHAGCSSSSDAAFAAAAVRLQPLWALMQHAQHDCTQQQQQQGAGAGSADRQHGSQQQQQQQQPGLSAKLSVDYQQALSSFLATLQQLPDACRTAALQLSALQSLSLLLQASTGLLQPCAVAAWLRDAAQAVLGIHGSGACISKSGSGISHTARQMRSKASTQQPQQRPSEETVAELLTQLGPFVPPVLPGRTLAAGAAAAASSTVSMALPPLVELLPVLQPAVAPAPAAEDSDGSSGDAAAQVQAAALQLLHSYLEAAAQQPGSLSVSKQLLLDALALVCSPSAAVRNAALQLVQLFMQPAVLQEAFGSQPEPPPQQQQPQPQQRRRQRNTAAAAAAAAVAAPAADVDVEAGQSLPRRLLEHLRSMLGSTAAAQQGGQQQLQHSIAAQQSVLRAIAGCYSGLASSGGCAELPLLYLLEQCALSEYGQVRGIALSLLQQLALRHTASRELEELLVAGPAGAALLSAVGRALAGQPALFVQLAQLVQLAEDQLAVAVAPHVVPWLCQQQLKEPLELLAGKLGLDAARLVLFCSDGVLAERMWFNPEGLAGLVEFVDELVAPDSFVSVVQSMGRRMARCLIEKAGAACFWGAQHTPPPEMLSRAREYVGIVANGMGQQLQGPDRVLELLQGETLALLLKNIGNTLAQELEPPAAMPIENAASTAVAVTAGAAAGRGDSWGSGCWALQAALQKLCEERGLPAAPLPGLSYSLGLSGAGGSGGPVSAADKMQCLRALVVLMHLLGEHLGSHALQMMAVLSEALLYCTDGPLRMQALSGWLVFVQLLAQHAPAVLQRVAAHAAVVLLPVLGLTSQEGSTTAAAGAAAAQAGGEAAAGEVDTAAVQLAADVLHEIVVKQRQHVRAALRNMPPLPSLDVLKEVNQVLAQEQPRQGPLQQLQLLIGALQHESMAVRHVALGEVRSFLLQHKTFMSDAMSGLLSCSGPAALPQDANNKADSGAAAGTGQQQQQQQKGKGGKAGSGDGSSSKLAPGQCRELVSQLLAALLASCANLPRVHSGHPRSHMVQSMKQRCAQCLGLLGAIDPAHVKPQLPKPAPFAYRAESCLVALLQQHLVRVLQTAYDIGQLETTSYAIQSLLQHYTKRRLQAAARAMKAFAVGPIEGLDLNLQAQQQQQDLQAASEPGSLFSLLEEGVQSIVRPFLTTKFCIAPRQRATPGVVFGSHAHTFRRWLNLWLKQLAELSSGPLAPAFEACRGVMAWDAPLMMGLLPYMMAEVAGQGGEGLELVVREISAVMQCAARGPDHHIDEIELYLQCIFGQLDLLQRWVQEQQAAAEKQAADAAAQAAAAGGNRQAQPPVVDVALPPFVANVASILTAIPIETRAQAALRCGSYARALQYFESYVRDKHGGGLNPSAFNGGCSSYNYDDVSFLLEVYGQLEEPDGLAGLVQLRQGGLTTSDQILVAEKAGAWSEALALYELALSQEAATAAETTAAAAADRPSAAGAAADVLIQAARAVAAGGSANSSDLEPLLRPAGSNGAAAAAAAAAAGVGVGSYHGLSSLQIGHLRSLLQMGHHQTLLRQVDGLIARCLSGSGSASNPDATDMAQNLNPDPATLGTLNPGGLGVSAEEMRGMGGAQWWITQLAALGLAAAWRLGAWGTLRGYLGVIEAAADAGVKPVTAADKWEVCVGTILEAAQRHAYPAVLIGITRERAEVLEVLPAVAGESYARCYPELLKLHMLQELEDACGLMQRPQPVGPLVRSRALRWRERLPLTAPLLSCREPLLALRRQLAGLAADSEAMGRCWLQHAKLCRSTGHQEAAETSVLEASARGVPGALLERCRLLWEREKGHRAVMELQLAVQQMLDGDAQPEDAALQHQRAKEMLQLTEWMAAVGQGHKDMLRANYEDAIQLDGSWEKAHFSYALYLDSLYRDAKQREGKPAASKGMDRLSGRSRVRTPDDSPLDYLPQALEHYGESIRAGHKHILQSLPRLLTLYFEFGSKVAASKAVNQKMRNTHTQVSGVMRGLLRNIPPYKWLLVLPQLTSRICHPQQDVQDFMQQLLGAIADHFPHQALWAMATVCKSTVRARQEAASSILNQAKRRSGEAGRSLFEVFARLADQLIRACMWQPPSDRRVTRCSAFKEFKHLVNMLPVDVQVPVQALFTVDLPPGGKLPPGHRPVCSQATIQGLRDEVIVMSSLMKPKKITFIGSDGADYPFLAKPKDDLRKDYRLMDFAGTLNALLARQPQARRRGLCLRTYAVLPLTDDCGLLQWVEHLVPFKAACEEVLGKERLYSRHSTPHQIKKMYDGFAGSNRAQLLDRVLQSLPPRLGKWLLARFPEPGTWLAARLAFTRTNAAWAMVGHVLGLGDRHGDNIMIHSLTGETMHVDFGCLFDKGLTLEVPEMVPFRLTQNVVDAFGVSGVEGAFRRAAEMTLQVLRANKATLMTCAETFLHDPLVDWARGSKGGSTAAAAGPEAENPQAKDALAVMEGRLSGTLLGVAAIPSLPLSCEGQAARLIEEASDHENLGKMYIWWMPWL